ncbi:DNA polymerase lambda-like protein [Geranomyces variabilis]|nr:DNA polymerase lambda-like protein [Geranomyces variabilis]
MGICRLPGGPGIHRRLDIWAVPWDEIGAALVHWTGNTIFNMRLRQLAAKKGMRLSQHGLFAIHDTTRDARTPRAKDLADGVRVASRTEEEIFEALGVRYRPPEGRNL